MIRALLYRSRREVEAQRLTKTEFKYVHYLVRKGPATTPELAEVFGVSIQAAAVIMARVKGKGYVKRTDVGDPSGGTMYLYEQCFL